LSYARAWTDDGEGDATTEATSGAAPAAAVTVAAVRVLSIQRRVAQGVVVRSVGFGRGDGGIGRPRV
jgi:hypothetical protein